MSAPGGLLVEPRRVSPRGHAVTALQLPGHDQGERELAECDTLELALSQWTRLGGVAVSLPLGSETHHSGKVPVLLQWGRTLAGCVPDGGEWQWAGILGPWCSSCTRRSKLQRGARLCKLPHSLGTSEVLRVFSVRLCFRPLWVPCPWGLMELEPRVLGGPFFSVLACWDL